MKLIKMFTKEERALYSRLLRFYLFLFKFFVEVWLMQTSHRDWVLAITATARFGPFRFRARIVSQTIATTHFETCSATTNKTVACARVRNHKIRWTSRAIRMPCAACWTSCRSLSSKQINASIAKITASNRVLRIEILSRFSHRTKCVASGFRLHYMTMHALPHEIHMRLLSTHVSLSLPSIDRWASGCESMHASHVKNITD